VEEYDANVEKVGLVVDELVALLPEEPATELEAKAAELVALVIAHLEMLAMAEDDGAEVEAEAAAEAPVEVADV
jgi:hypothetical protein